MESISMLINLALWALLSLGTNHTTLEQPVKTGCRQAAPTQTTHIHREPSGPAQMNQNRGRDSWQKPDEVLKAINLRPGQVIADIGAGDGYFTRRFAEAVGPGGKAIGIDVDPSAVRAMTADAQKLGLTNYEARLVPAEDPMLAPESVEVIFVCDTYHHIDNRIPYFTRIKAALRPGGRLLIIDFPRTTQTTSHNVNREELVKELEQAGYRLTKEFDFLLPRQLFMEFEPVKPAINQELGQSEGVN